MDFWSRLYQVRRGLVVNKGENGRTLVELSDFGGRFIFKRTRVIHFGGARCMDYCLMKLTLSQGEMPIHIDPSKCMTPFRIKMK